jgi:hypothetical protein
MFQVPFSSNHVHRAVMPRLAEALEEGELYLERVKKFVLRSAEWR